MSFSQSQALPTQPAAKQLRHLSHMLGPKLPIRTVGRANRAAFAAPLAAMHQARARIFVDTLKWDLTVDDNGREIDEYDREDTVYLMVLDAQTGDHLGSVRLLPSQGPHLLGDHFPSLCEEGVPRGPDIWEITRLVTRPGLSRDAAEHVRRHVSIAMFEFALANGIRQYTMMTHMQFLASVLAVGWTAEPLGFPQPMDGVMVGALRIDVDAATLARLRQQWNLGDVRLRTAPNEIGTDSVLAF